MALFHKSVVQFLNTWFMRDGVMRIGTAGGRICRIDPVLTMDVVKMLSFRIIRFEIFIA